MKPCSRKPVGLRHTVDKNMKFILMSSLAVIYSTLLWMSKLIKRGPLCLMCADPSSENVAKPARPKETGGKVPESHYTVLSFH